MMTPKKLHERRTERTRYQIKRKSAGRVRLSVFRSGRNIYAQIIDDAAGKTLCAMSTMDADLRRDLKTGADKNAAIEVGKQIAAKAIKLGIKQVVFDRGGYVYHGRIKALAEAAREAGLDF
jgi:large subunit ribosomal protein L18